MNSVEERITALQILEALLTSIPTESLLDVCLDFPYLLDVLFYDDYQKGLEVLKKEFNGFNELFNRKDFGKCALAKCKKILGFIKLSAFITLGKSYALLQNQGCPSPISRAEV